MEFKPADPLLCGHPLGYHTVEVTKGCGRLTILWFTVLYTYLELSKTWSVEEQGQFKQYLEST